MADEVIEKKPEGTTKVEPPAKPEVKVEAKTEPAEKTPAKTEIKTEVGKSGDRKAAKLGADDDDIPDDAELLELTPSALGKRLARHTRRELKERFGTTDPDEIKKKLDRLVELEAKEEERERASMSEREKLEADLKKEKTRAFELERTVNEVRLERIVEKQDAAISSVMESFIDADYVDIEASKLADHFLEKFSVDELKKMTDKERDKEIGKWCKDRVEKKPKLARDAGDTPKVPLDNGAKDARNAPPPGGGGLQPSNYKPGGANSLTPAQARAAAAREGYRW